MKLNLVPDYVKQRKINKQIIALLVVLFLVVNAGMVFWFLSVRAQLSALQEEKANLEMQAQRVDTLDQQARQIIQSATIALAKTEWVRIVQEYNPKYAQLYAQVNRYTSPRVRYAAMQVQQGNQLQISAFAKGIREIGLYLQTMYQCPLFSSVSLTSPSVLPGYPSAEDAQQMLGGGQALGGIGLGMGGVGGGAPMGFGGGAPAGGFGGTGQTQGSPAGLMNFQIVAVLKEPITPPQPPASLPGLNLGGGMPGGAPGGFGRGIGFGG